jgi:7,8-dihydropterin-6-yl-methyl-4-(beta-D-ribofuranosyl)aminobenzene 5'-phosphate synthase
MIIKVLVENTSSDKNLGTEHALSIYIETSNHRLLFDTGGSPLFIENARKLNVDLSKVDTTVISHGHHDHGGGIESFLKINSKSKIYLNENAFGHYYANDEDGSKRYIGLDHKLIPNERFVFAGNYFKIDNELELFSGVNKEELYPNLAGDLLMRTKNSFTEDNFAHEQNLIINEKGKTILLTGCAHNGIINILKHFYNLKNCLPDYVIGGFHLMAPSKKQDEHEKLVEKTAEYLAKTKVLYYTCHCTGIESYNKLKAVIKKNIDYVSTGTQLVI